MKWIEAYWNLFALLLLLTLNQRVTAQLSIADTRVNQDAQVTGRDQNETSIAISPINPNKIVAGSNYIYPGVNYRAAYYWSDDGGVTWTEGILPLGGNYDKAGDPALSFDAIGNVYYAHLSNDPAPPGAFSGDNGIFVNRSTDGGVTWMASPFIVAQNGTGGGGQGQTVLEDRPYLTCDIVSGSPYLNNTYVAWVRGFEGSPSQIFFSRKDYDVGQFSNPIQISQTGNVRAPVPAVGPGGVIYVVWFNTGDNSIRLVKSTNGGATFGPEQTIVSGIIEVGEVKLHVRALSYATIAIDNSGGPRTGNLYITWGGRDASNVSPEIFLRVSSDGGSTWGTIRQVNPVTATDQWFPWAAVSANGLLHIVYYDKQDDPISNILTDVYLATSTDGGATFTYQKANTVSFTPPSPGTGQAFMGDYNGIAATPAFVYPYWTDRRSSAGDLDVYVALAQYGFNTTVDQKLNSGTTVGSISRWDVSTFVAYPAPKTFPLAANATEYFLGEQVIRQGEKYNNWNNEDDVTNHRRFDTGQSFPFYLPCNFQPTYGGIVIKTDLLDAPGTTGGTIKFKDPWLIDSVDAAHGNGPLNRGEADALFKERLSPFNPDLTTSYYGDVYMGVFLDQSFTGNSYYSVEAPQPNMIGGFSSYFSYWSGVGANVQNTQIAQTAVEFDQANAELTALYKTNLGSSLSSATASNGQRKFVQQEVTPQLNSPKSINDAFVSYESAGEVWLTQGVTQAGPYGAEVRVSDGTGSFGNPSIAVGNTDDLYVTYTKTSGGNTTVLFSERRSGIWEDAENLTTASGSAWPVIARTNTQWTVTPDVWTRPLLVAVWQQTDGIRGNIANGETDGGWTWSPQIHQLTGPGYANPSISSTYLKPDGSQQPFIYITYDDGDDVFLKPFGGNWSEPIEMATASLAPDCNSSQVSADTRDASSRRAHIVWQTSIPALDRGNGRSVSSSANTKVMYQRWSSSTGWGSAHQFQSGTNSFQRPSITNMANGHLAMVWDNGTKVYEATYDGSSWSSFQISGLGTRPTLINSGTEGPLTATKFISMSSSGPPYRLQVSTETFTAPGGEEPLAEIYSRRIEAVELPPPDTISVGRSDTLGFFSVELSPIHLKLTDGSMIPVGFVAVNDTMPALNESTAWEKLGTVEVTLPVAVDSVLLSGSAEAFLPVRLGDTDTLTLSFNVYDGANGRLIRTIGAENLFWQNELRPLSTRAGIRTLGGRQVRIRPVVSGITPERSDFAYGIVHVHTLLDDSSAGMTLSHRQSLQSDDVPLKFDFLQNYPNPFNPSTRLSFDLPEGSNVTLVVYDVLGREVTRLVEGYRAAGRHTVRWNPAEASSGLYLARIRAVGLLGEEKLSKTVKLIYVK